MARHLTTAADEFEADIILSRLADAGIHAWPQSRGPSGGAFVGGMGGLFGRGMGGARNIYVEETDLERAKEALAAAQDVDEDELIELSERDAPPEES